MVAIRVRITPRDRLDHEACDHYNALWSGRGKDTFASPQDDSSFLQRITVNMLRHEGTRYEEYLSNIFGQVGVMEARTRVKTRILQAIAERYPDLTGECQKQSAALLEDGTI